MTLIANVVARKIYRQPPYRLVQGARGADELQLTLDDEWADMEQVVLIWSCGGNSVTVPFEGNPATIPWAVLEQSGALYLSVVGYTLDDAGAECRRIVTAKMSSPWAVEAAGETEGEDVRKASPDLLTQLSSAAELAKVAAQTVQAQAERGDFIGPAGPPGPQGPKGPKGAAGEKGEGVYELLAAAGYPGTREQLAAQLVALLETVPDVGTGSMSG